MPIDQLVLAGAGGHARVVAEAVRVCGDFGACGRRAGFLNRGLNEGENLLLAGGKLGAIEHGKLLVELVNRTCITLLATAIENSLIAHPVTGY